jgi:transposase
VALLLKKSSLLFSALFLLPYLGGYESDQPNGAAAKAGLNKAILDGAPAHFLSILRYKAAEAGIVYAAAPTRQLKPSQRCHQCWGMQKKRLDDRWHTCPCGVHCHRDLNAALVLLRWGMEHTLAVFLAAIWSQELAPGPRSQSLPLEPVA